ncbi:MAG: hypothetical protein JST73_10890 [Actinobacteria bacterium]|nr:hypothetical protein [Actinomycetota bacterium]
MRPDGSGSVTVDVFLDADAAAHVGDVSRMLAVDDLKRAGWTIAGPTTAHDGGVQIRLTHPFADVAGANTLLATLGGADGPFHGVRLTRTSSTFSTKYGFTGTVDLRKGLDTFGDPELTKALGCTLTDTVTKSGEKLPSGGDLVVGLQIVPSKSLAWSGRMGNDSMGNETVSASVPLGGGPETIDVHATQTHWANIAAVIGAGATLLAMIVLVVLGRRRRRRPLPGTRRRRFDEITVSGFDG